jgi:uncharacterized membrane protein YphA (DoxX/SURF4 family)
VKTAGEVLAVGLGLLFMITGGVKVVGLKQSLEIRDHFGMTPRLWRIIGALESAGGLGVILGLGLRPLGLAAAAGLSALMVGAVIERRRVRDPIPLIVFDLLVLALVLVEATVRLNSH